MNKHTVVLIKLGGSVITNKEVPMSLRASVLKRLISEIVRAREEKPNILFVVGHGHGSFGHIPLLKYGTMQGFINDQSKLGMAIVQDTAAQLNRTVVHEFIEQGIPAVSLYPSNSLVTKKRVPEMYFTEVFEMYLKQGLFPVTCGDVLVDVKQGCAVWSTEEVLSFFARKFVKKGWNVQKVIHVVGVDGVYDGDHKVLFEVTEMNWPRVQKSITATRGFDATGGMGLKIRESLDLTKLGISSLILSGNKKDNLYHALVGKHWMGTTICPL